MKDLLEMYLRFCDREKGLSPTTLQSYLSSCRSWFKWFREDTGREPTLADWTESYANAYHASLKQRGCRQSTRQRNVASLRLLGVWLVENGHATANPWLKIRTPVNEQQRQPCPNASEVRALFDACDRLPNRLRGMKAKTALALLALAGLRMCEMVAVRISDLTLTGDRKYVTIPNGKGGKQRTVPLNAMAVDILTQWITVRPATDLPNLIYQAGSRLGDRKYTDTSFSRILLTLKRIARMEAVDITAHALRRFAATSIAQQQGASIADAMRFLGHSSPEVTLRYLKQTNDLFALTEGILAEVPSIALPPVAEARPVPLRPVDRQARDSGPRRSAWRRA